MKVSQSSPSHKRPRLLHVACGGPEGWNEAQNFGVLSPLVVAAVWYKSSAFMHKKQMSKSEFPVIDEHRFDSIGELASRFAARAPPVLWGQPYPSLRLPGLCSHSIRMLSVSFVACGRLIGFGAKLSAIGVLVHLLAPNAVFVDEKRP